MWSKSRYIEAEVSARGLAFVLKRRPPFQHARLFLEIDRPFCKLTPIGKRGDTTGVLDGAGVRLENQTGDILAERSKARQYFPGGRRLLYWDDLDMAYFANYAFWNYFTFPALLMNEDIIWEEKGDLTLQATFPDSIPTHSKVQKFHFRPDDGLLAQHDYTADIISRYARAANVILKHDQRDGPPYPSARRVTPRAGNGLPLKWPVLIDIEVHDFRLTNDVP